MAKIEDDSYYYEAIRWRCEENLEMFSRIFFAHFCTNSFNEFHKEYFKTVKFRETLVRRAWASPRGSAKSVLISLIKPIHDVCYALEHFILLVSNTETLAAQKAKDIRSEILSNDSLRYCYGLSFEKRKPSETEFVVVAKKHRCFFMAVGAGAQIRGTRYCTHRPTKIIIDDLEHSEKVYSEKQREKTKRFVDEDVTKTGDPTRTNIEIVGTILHTQSYLKQVLNNPMYTGRLYKSVKQWPDRQDLWDEWERILMNIQDNDRLKNSDEFYKQNEKEMLKNFVVMWPDREPPLYLMKEKCEIGKRAFYKEKQNEPMGADERVFERILWYSSDKKGIYIEDTEEFIRWEHLTINSYGALDPATGQSKPSKTKRPDYACMLSGYHDPKGRLLVHNDWTKRQPPTKQIEAIFDNHDVFEYQKFAVETNLYRELLLPNIIDEKRRREKLNKKAIKIPFYDVENTENKDKRIHRLEPKVSHGWILFHRTLTQEFVQMMEEYPFSDHDDGPDCLEMLWNLCHGYYKASSISLNAMNR